MGAAGAGRNRAATPLSPRESTPHSCAGPAAAGPPGDPAAASQDAYAPLLTSLDSSEVARMSEARP
jgi:hypothetical protein